MIVRAGWLGGWVRGALTGHPTKSSQLPNDPLIVGYSSVFILVKFGPNLTFRLFSIGGSVSERATRGEENVGSKQGPARKGFFVCLLRQSRHVVRLRWALRIESPASASCWVLTRVHHYELQSFLEMTHFSAQK